jgi:hypothetical protein
MTNKRINNRNGKFNSGCRCTFNRRSSADDRRKGLADPAVFEDFVEHVGDGAGAGAEGLLRIVDAAS